MEQRNLNDERSLRNPLPVLVIILLVALAAIIYYLAKPKAATEEEPLPTPSASAEAEVITVVEEQQDHTTVTVEEVRSVLESASELITSRYFYTNAADFDSVLTWFDSDIPNPFTHSKGYIMYDGVISIGIAMKDVDFEVDNIARTITVTLPQETVLAHEIDNDSVTANSSESIFNTLDAEYYEKLIGNFKKETQKKVLGNQEYMKTVRANTELAVRDILLSSDLTRNFEIKFQ